MAYSKDIDEGTVCVIGDEDFENCTYYQCPWRQLCAITQEKKRFRK